MSLDYDNSGGAEEGKRGEEKRREERKKVVAPRFMVAGRRKGKKEMGNGRGLVPFRRKPLAGGEGREAQLNGEKIGFHGRRGVGFNRGVSHGRRGEG